MDKINIYRTFQLLYVGLQINFLKYKPLNQNNYSKYLNQQSKTLYLPVSFFYQKQNFKKTYVYASWFQSNNYVHEVESYRSIKVESVKSKNSILFTFLKAIFTFLSFQNIFTILVVKFGNMLVLPFITFTKIKENLIPNISSLYWFLQLNL